MTTLDLDPSRPYQTQGELIAFWRPRGGERDAMAEGLIAIADVCQNPTCSCTDAQLQALRIDDRAVQAVLGGGSLRISWRNHEGGPPLPEGAARIQIDIVSGSIRWPDGGAPDPTVAKFFTEPLPFWVLDHLWERWSTSRPLRVDWRAQALRFWEPGTLLPAMIAFPEWRPDRYEFEGVMYQVDSLFCVTPGCDCTEARLVVFTVSGDGKQLEEAGTARLSLETMIPVEFESYGLDHRTFSRIYLDWTRRQVPAEARFREQRDLVWKRGQELHAAAVAVARPGGAAPGFEAAPPARKAPCPCGSGRKFKHCCGRPSQEAAQCSKAPAL